MPIPIMPVPDQQSNENSATDYSFLMNLSPSDAPKKKTVQASNNDASLLFEIWASGEKCSDENTIKISKTMEVTSREIMRLKTMGFLTGGTEEVKFTNRGKAVITTMSLGETNQFKNSRKEKSYTEILASMDKRGKKGFRTAQYSNCPANCLDISKL